MASFTKHALELSSMELFTYLAEEQIHRERAEVLLADDLRPCLYNRYAKDGITPGEVDEILLRLCNISSTMYEANKAVHKLLYNGVILNREDRIREDLYIELIEYDSLANNILKEVNQFEVKDVGGQLRILDGIVLVNGIPVVVLEFKSVVKENIIIIDAYTQLPSATEEIFRSCSNIAPLQLSATV